ncbi:hypothetical protein [Puniceicoccus vermicola]|uniref:Uncharacterized protein n=1 Tax=Puniceicoccus vermicola TaxID=388746 RepID=A0A7X1E5N2_9BACT|nr:hypothetical protein [Puniceicoccus vermicola]MBC2603228.1 hypothetical protein [Puniceicoccus vermicola]
MPALLFLDILVDGDRPTHFFTTVGGEAGVGFRGFVFEVADERWLRFNALRYIYLGFGGTSALLKFRVNRISSIFRTFVRELPALTPLLRKKFP